MIYYWETENANGRLRASSDEEALDNKPENCWVLYKESDTEDGLPFIILYEDSEVVKRKLSGGGWNYEY